jgi:hypothetical protein
VRYRAALHSEDSNDSRSSATGQDDWKKIADLFGFFTQQDRGIVNLAATGFGTDDDGRRATRRVVAGVAVSLAVHALMLAGWRGERVYRPEPPRPLAVRVQAPPPPPPVETPVAVPPPLAQQPARASKPRKPRPVIAVRPEPTAPAQPDPFIVEQAPEPAPPDTPRFDPEAARRMARSLANMRDPAKEGTAIGQFPEKPLETESRAARAIGAAKRRNCKDGIPGGLLAPLLLLADKKDSGCKW